MMRTANPALNANVFRNAAAVQSDSVMTLEGTVNKTAMSVVLTIIAAYWGWTSPAVLSFYIPIIIGTFVIAIALYFKQTWAPVLTPVYALAEGAMLGAISALFETRYPGIVVQAVGLTFGTLFSLLMAYKTGWIKATENFKLGVFAATGAIGLFYLGSMLLSLFGVGTNFLASSSLLSIGISAVVVVVAALNLVLDFDFIEQASANGRTPKYMEWYAAFGLLVTLVWLYLEILRMLAKIADNRR